MKVERERQDCQIVLFIRGALCLMKQAKPQSDAPMWERTKHLDAKERDLLWAAANGDLDLLVRVLDARIIRAHDSLKMTALHFACRHGHGGEKKKTLFFCSFFFCFSSSHVFEQRLFVFCWRKGPTPMRGTKRECVPCILLRIMAILNAWRPCARARRR